MDEVTTVTIAVEDDLAEVLVTTAIAQSGLPIAIGPVLQKKGITYLRSRSASLNRAASGGAKIILLADSDSDRCPAELAEEWFPQGRHSNLAFRFSVQAAEAWILADTVGFATYAGVAQAHMPRDPDKVQDPKRSLVNIARRGKRSFRDLVVPSQGMVIPVGVGYNAALTHFVETNWSLNRATERSKSLGDFLSRITRLVASS